MEQERVKKQADPRQKVKYRNDPMFGRTRHYWGMLKIICSERPQPPNRPGRENNLPIGDGFLQAANYRIKISRAPDGRQVKK
jgi:hypothetical protein